MSALLPAHPRLFRTRNGVGGRQLLIVQRATVLINDLGDQLDRQLANERRATERLRLLRETTNRITRAANDAIDAYRTAQRALARGPSASDPKGAGALAMRARLKTARLDLLRAIDVAGRRYPSAPVSRPAGGSPRPPRIRPPTHG